MKTNKTSRTKKTSCWKGWYLGFDYLMTGPFIKLISVVSIVALLCFILCSIIAYNVSGWDLGESFIQLTNPERHRNESVDDTEWFSIVLLNLFGLFVLNGVLLTIFVNWVSNRKDRHENGEARYKHIHTKHFAVIIGGHKMVASLARSLVEKESIDFVLIQTQRKPDIVRKEVFAEITDEKLARNVIIYSGDRTSWHELEELKLEKAQEIYIIGESVHIDGTSHDALNLQCWDTITKHLNEAKATRIPVHVMFEYQSTFSAFQYTDLKFERSKTFRFIPFSIFETWAQQVLIGKNTSEKLNYEPLDGWNGLPYSSHQRVHLIVIGMSKMGVALAIEAAHLAHYPNFNNKDTGRPRTLITFIDRNAKREMLYFMGRFRELFQLARWRYVKAPVEELMPSYKDKAARAKWNIYDTIQQIADNSNKEYPWHNPLTDEDFNSPYYGNYLGEDFIDIDFEFIEGDVALPSIQNYIKEASADNSARVNRINIADGTSLPDSSSKTTIAVCLPVAVEAMSAALYFDPSVYNNAQQILVQQPESEALVNALREGLTGEDSSKFKILKPFGMIDKCDYLSRINSILPKLVAYAYECLSNHTTLFKKYKSFTNCQDFINEVEQNWLNISSDKGKSGISKRWSNLYCANSFDTKVRCAGIDLASDDEIKDENTIRNLAKVEHNRWVIEQLLLGERPVDRSYAGKLPINDGETRKKLKSQNMHPDLISNEMLGVTQMYDEGIAKIIPLALMIASRIDSENK